MDLENVKNSPIDVEIFFTVRRYSLQVETLIHTQAVFFGTPKMPNKYLVPFDKHQLYIVQADRGAHNKPCAGGTAACPP